MWFFWVVAWVVAAIYGAVNGAVKIVAGIEEHAEAQSEIDAQIKAMDIQFNQARLTQFRAAEETKAKLIMQSATTRLQGEEGQRQILEGRTALETQAGQAEAALGYAGVVNGGTVGMIQAQAKAAGEGELSAAEASFRLNLSQSALGIEMGGKAATQSEKDYESGYVYQGYLQARDELNREYTYAQWDAWDGIADFFTGAYQGMQIASAIEGFLPGEKPITPDPSGTTPSYSMITGSSKGKPAYSYNQSEVPGYSRPAYKNAQDPVSFLGNIQGSSKIIAQNIAPFSPVKKKKGLEYGPFTDRLSLPSLT